MVLLWNKICLNGTWTIKWSRDRWRDVDPQRCCETVRSSILATAGLLVLNYFFACFQIRRLLREIWRWSTTTWTSWRCRGLLRSTTEVLQFSDTSSRNVTAWWTCGRRRPRSTRTRAPSRSPTCLKVKPICFAWPPRTRVDVAPTSSWRNPSLPNYRTVRRHVLHFAYSSKTHALGQ